MKLMTPMDALGAQMAWVGDSSELLVRFIAVAEIAGALGMILPPVTRIVPVFTPLAGVGLAVIQVLAMGVHLMRGEFGVLPVNLVLLALALFVAWGRWRKAPIAPRA